LATMGKTAPSAKEFSRLILHSQQRGRMLRPKVRPGLEPRTLFITRYFSGELGHTLE
jgi:hypothetical protein